MQKAKENVFDLVHDTQHTYRQLLDCMARPGKLGNISNASNKMKHNSGLSAGLGVIAQTLLDRETSFYVWTKQQDEAVQYIQWSTFSRHATLQQAQYIFLDDMPEGEELSVLMQTMNRGTLTDPHLGATVIVSVKELAKMGSYESLRLRLRLTGPGIAHEQICFITGVSSQFFHERAVVNKEYPLGIDIILVTECGTVMAIPRTTLVESE